MNTTATEEKLRRELERRGERCLVELSTQSLRIVHRTSVSSTMDVVREGLKGDNIEGGFFWSPGKLPPGLCVVADSQTIGRGREQRHWISTDQAGVYLSIGFVDDGQLLRPGLSLAVGVSLCEALDPDGDKLGLKWPNDIVLRSNPARKVGGILIESASRSIDENHVVIGCGVNVRAQAFPNDISAGTLDVIFEKKHDLIQTIAAVVLAVGNCITEFRSVGFKRFQPNYEIRCVLRGLHGRLVLSHGEAHEGTICGIDSDGALVLSNSQGQRSFFAGEVRETRVTSS